MSIPLSLYFLRELPRGGNQYLYPFLEIHGSVGIILKLRAGHLRNGSSIPSRGPEIPVFSVASRPALESTETHIQPAPGTLPPEVQRPNHLQLMTS
jgi:hypothetical protein